MHLFWIIVWKFLAILWIFPLLGSPEDMLQEANTAYQQGEKASTYEERKLAFNRALFLYNTLEQEMPSSSGLNQALGDTYFQLNEYAWAILYYSRALKNEGQNPLLFSHLETAQQKLGLLPSRSIEQKTWKKPFVFLSQQFQWLFWIIALTFLAFSLVIWLPFPWLRKLAISCALLLALLLGNFLFFHYFTPLEGILVKTTGFYRAPDWNQPQITNAPLLAGTKVQILGITPDKNWLKIEASEATMGYIPITSLRPI